MWMCIRKMMTNKGHYTIGQLLEELFPPVAAPILVPDRDGEPNSLVEEAFRTASAAVERIPEPPENVVRSLLK